MTAAGTQRWFCTFCKASAIKPRPDLKQAKQARHHNQWLLGKHSQTECAKAVKTSARSFRRKTAWCWDKPSQANAILTGEIHHTVIIDGVRIGSTVCLIARTVRHVVAWHWAAYESNENWSTLLGLIPAPKYVVCDGQKGMLLAIASWWPTTTVQRCRFHVWLNIKAKLTRYPKAAPDKTLVNLTLDLLKIQSKRDARRWKKKLKAWYKQHLSYIDQKTVTTTTTATGKRTWHYTHKNTRSAYKQLYKLRHDATRFCYRPSPELPASSNYVEGGINAQLRNLLKLHRGMSQEHQMKLVEAYLFSRSEAAGITTKSGQKPPR